MLYGLGPKEFAARLGVESTRSFEDRMHDFGLVPVKTKPRLTLVIVESRDFVAVYEDSVEGRMYNFYPRTSKTFDAEHVRTMLKAKGHFVLLDTEVDPFMRAFEQASAEWWKR